MKIVNVDSVAGRADRLKPIMQVQQFPKTALTTAQQWNWTRDVDLFIAAEKEIEDLFKIGSSVNGFSVVDSYMENDFLDGGWKRGQNRGEPVQDETGVCTWIAVNQCI